MKKENSKPNERKVNLETEEKTVLQLINEYHTER